MATSSRRRRSTPESTAPARRRRVARDEEPEEEPPRRRRRTAAEEEPAERRPRRRRVAEEEEEDEPTTRRNRGGRSRSSRSYDDEDDPVARPSMPKGFGGAAELRKQTGGDFPTEFRVTEDRQIVKFLDDEPFVVYNQHWFNNRKGKKSFVCPQTIGDDCPLCDLLDDKPRTFAAFNVVVIPPEDPDPRKNIVTGDPVLQVITAAVRLTGVIESESAILAENDRGLSDAYFSISKSGQEQQTSYKLNPIKERDLDEDFGVIPLDDDEIDEFVEEMYDETTFPYRPTTDTLEEIAAEMMK